MPHIDVDRGVRLYAQDVGDGPPVVLVAGFGLDHRVWDRQVRVLAGAHRVICVDQRGHGRSDRPLDGYEMDRLALDLRRALDGLGVRACALVGWSFGGQVAFKAAADDPGLVSRLVLVGSNGVRASRSEGFPFGGDAAELEAALVAGERGDRLRARRATITTGFASPPEEDTVRWLLDQSLRMPSWAAVACYHTMLHADLTRDLPTIAMPVLQVRGSADPVHSAKGARWLAARLADARLTEIGGCGHYPMLEAPDEFDAVLLDFLARDKSRAGAVNDGSQGGIGG